MKEFVVYGAVAFGVVGMAVAAMLLEASGVAPRVFPHWSGAIGGVGAGLATAWCLADWATPRVATMPMADTLRLGGVAGVLSALYAVVIGGIVQLIVNQSSHGALAVGESLLVFVLQPLFWVLFFGLVPAAALGCCCGAILKWVIGRRSRRLATG